MRFTAVDHYFNEHVHMPGFPSVVVTRGYLYQFLRECGYDPKERGLGSLDSMVAAARQTEAELTDEPERDRLLALLREAITPTNIRQETQR